MFQQAKIEENPSLWGHKIQTEVQDIPGFPSFPHFTLPVTCKYPLCTSHTQWILKEQCFKLYLD